MRIVALLLLSFVSVGLFACITTNPSQRLDFVVVNERGRDRVALEWLRKSTQSLEAGNWAEVIRTSSAAVSVDPLCDNAYVMRGIAYYKKHLLDQAMADCNKAIEINAENLLARNCKGLIYAQRGEPEKSRQELDQAIKKYGGTEGTGSVVRTASTDDEERVFRAACAAGLTVACETFRNMTGSYPASFKGSGNRLLDESHEKFLLRDWNGVIAKTSQAIRLNEKNAAAYVNRAGAYANKGMIKEAYEDSDKAVQLAPDFGLAYNNRGYAQERMGKIREAQLDYQMGCNRGVKLACMNFQRLKARNGQ